MSDEEYGFSDYEFVGTDEQNERADTFISSILGEIERSPVAGVTLALQHLAAYAVTNDLEPYSSAVEGRISSKVEEALIMGVKIQVGF